jgi:hypothetical protein
MEKTEEKIGFSKKFIERSKALDEGLKKVSEKLIAETKAANGYLVIADSDGNIKHVPAKDL